jgi:hypothetical protein
VLVMLAEHISNTVSTTNAMNPSGFVIVSVLQTSMLASLSGDGFGAWHLSGRAGRSLADLNY